MITAIGAAKLYARRSATSVFLVGGAVRDLRLGRRVRDLDFAVPEGEERLARFFAERGLGRAIALAPEHAGLPVWRVARPGATIDVARLAGGRIETDLPRRDFTVNAMAIELPSGALVDPFGGRRDLRARRLRLVAESNLADDPLRVLRAYRLCAELGFRIARASRGPIRRHAGRLRRASAERRHEELRRLLTADRGVPALAAAVEDGVVGEAVGLPIEASGRSVRRWLAASERAPGDRAAGRLAILLWRLSIDPGRADAALSAARFSRDERARVARNARFLAAAAGSRPAGEVLFEFRGALPENLALFSRAAVTAREKARARALASSARRCERRPAPVDGNDVSRWTGLAPGPRLGHALEAARREWFLRRWRSRREIEAGLRRGGMWNNRAPGAAWNSTTS